MCGRSLLGNREISWLASVSMRAALVRVGKPRTECCCHSVAVTRDAIVAPADVRSIAMIRSCLVSCGKFGRCVRRSFGGARLGVISGDRAGRSLQLSLTFGHGIVEVWAAPSAAPPQPHPGKY